ncbi:hypothetical protein GS466_08985 [Rhodococcus hoagii]|nr:hypothetical protein [Prescottella equi]
MAHWSSGYADFHDELYAEPSTPFEPPLLHCADCDATFTELAELRQHVFATHPTAHPGLTFRGKTCGDARLLVQNTTAPSDWITTNTTWTQINDLDVAPADFGARMAQARGVTDVRLGNDRSKRKFSFDFAVPTAADLRGVDDALGRLIDKGRLDASSISSFIDSAHRYPTARNYTDGIAEYLYWLSGRQADIDVATSDRNVDKLNRAAHLLLDVPRPAAHVITSLVSLYFNHFDEAAARALSPRLRDVAHRLNRMLQAHDRSEYRAGVEGRMSSLELLLADRRTAELIELCSLPLDPNTTAKVDEFTCPTADSHDRLKYYLFTAEHHLTTGDPRAAQLIREGSQHGLPGSWVNARIDLITDKGSTCPPSPISTAHTKATTTPRARRKAQGDSTPTPVEPVSTQRTIPVSRGRKNTARATSEPTPSSVRSQAADGAPSLSPRVTPRISSTEGRRTSEALETTLSPVHRLPPIREGLGTRQTATGRTQTPSPATKVRPPASPTMTSEVAATPPWQTSEASSEARTSKPGASVAPKKSLLRRLLPWNK